MKIQPTTFKSRCFFYLNLSKYMKYKEVGLIKIQPTKSAHKTKYMGPKLCHHSAFRNVGT